VHPTYCRRCTSKKQTQYRKQRTGEQRDIGPLQSFLDGLRDEILEMASRIDDGNDAVQPVPPYFLDHVTEQIGVLLKHFSEHRDQLPQKVYDQRHPVVE
jgi:hypothetical protein